MSLYFGDIDIQQMYLGDLDPSAAYIGDVQIYPSSVVITGISITSAITSTVSGGVFNIRVKSESNWTLSVSDNTWITVSPASGTSGSSVVSVTISDNDTGADRNGYITATTTDNAYSAVCSISQEYMVPYIERYFTVVSLADDNTCTFNIPLTVTSAIATSISYSVDNGLTWNTTNVTSTNQNVSVSGLSNGDKVLWKGIAQKWSASSSSSFSAKFNCSSNYEVEGNLMSLFSGDNFIGVTTINSYGACYLFSQSSKLINAENLILPATTLNSNCYRAMFYGCSLLTTPPVLSATTLAVQAYRSMFQDCSSLNKIVCLATNRSQTQATFNWTAGVYATGTFTKASGTSWSTGVDGIPNDWTVVDYTG